MPGLTSQVDGPTTDQSWGRYMQNSGGKCYVDSSRNLVDIVEHLDYFEKLVGSASMRKNEDIKNFDDCEYFEKMHIWRILNFCERTTKIFIHLDKNTNIE